jgi:transcriptional regulator with XRE-family HTH domain
MYEIFRQLMEEKGVKHSDVSKATGISTSSLTDWKKGRYQPKTDKLQKIADYFGVSVEYIMTGKKQKDYYLNEETAEIAQQIFDNPELRILLDAARDVSPENIKLAAEMLSRMKETNPNG